MSIKVIGLNAVNSAFSSMIRTTPKSSKKHLLEASKETERVMKAQAPKATGKFASTIKFEIFPNLVSHIGPSDQAYSGRRVSATLEKGRRPGSPPPPWSALIDRYPALSVVQAMKAAQTISRRGVPGFAYAQKTFADISPKMSDYGLKAVLDITGSFNK